MRVIVQMLPVRRAAAGQSLYGMSPAVASSHQGYVLPDQHHFGRESDSSRLR
jgi:hypothetical protein